MNSRLAEFTTEQTAIPRSWLIALALVLAPHIAFTQRSIDRGADELVAEAAAVIDSWSGDRSTLEAAVALLSQALQKDESNPQAYVELARATIKGGYQRTTRGREIFADGTLDVAQGFLDRALAIDNRHVETYILYGHLATLQERTLIAREMLTRADALGTDSPWLHLNWADLLLLTGDAAGAVARYEAVLASDTDNLNARKAALAGLRDYYRRAGNMDKVEEAYVAEIRLEPDSAWSHGNYASFLLNVRPEQIDKALLHAERAIALMRYPTGLRLYVTALCRKRATLIVSDAAAAATFLAKAREVDGAACAGSPAD